MNRLEEDGPRSDIGSKYPEERVGTFDLYGEIESGDAFVRYCFARAEDARAFHSRFAATAHKAHLHTVS